MGTNYYAVKVKPTTERCFHIGKSSIGWKFNFKAQIRTWCDPPVVWRTFPELKAWLEEHVVKEKDFVILDDCDNEVSFDEFINLVEIRQKENNDKGLEYCDDGEAIGFQTIGSDGKAIPVSWIRSQIDYGKWQELVQRWREENNEAD